MVSLNYAQLKSVSQVEIYGQKLTCATMSDEEDRYFDTHFEGLFGTSDSVLRRILSERKDTIYQGVRAIKYALENPFFRGAVPADAEIGFSLIRPGHVKGWNRAWGARNTLQDSTGIGWRMQYASAMIWRDWLASAAGVGFLLTQWHGLIITHLSSHNSPTPFTVGVVFNVSRSLSVPFDLHHLLIGDNVNGVSYFPVPTQIALPRGEVLVRTVSGYQHIVVGGTGAVIDSLQLGGVTVATGQFLKQETYGAGVRYW